MRAPAGGEAGGGKKRAAGNPLSAGGSQGPLLLPKAEDISNLEHDFAGCKFAALFPGLEDNAAFSGIMAAAKIGGKSLTQRRKERKGKQSNSFLSFLCALCAFA